MLGEAYMSVQEPRCAVKTFHQALQMNPRNTILARKLGRAYVKTHQYNKAITYYQETLNNTEVSSMKLDLAELYLKLKKYQNAIDILALNMEHDKLDEQDFADLQFRIKQLLLLGRVYEKSEKNSFALQTLQEAHDNQHRVLKRVLVDQSGNISKQQKLLSKICLLMAQQSINLRENERALKCFRDCLKYTPNDVEILSSLARFYIQINSIELCRDTCLKILQIDNANEDASVMMADLSFRKMDLENSSFHFSQLLISKPCYWAALVRFIEVMRRSGTLYQTSSFLQRAENSINHPQQFYGLNYCKGLLELYSGNPNEALRYFNIARKDIEWGQQAIFNMIEICINPNGSISNSSEINDFVDDEILSDSRSIALRTAERLFKELRPFSSGINNEALNYKLLKNFFLLASRQKFQIENALQDFTVLAGRAEYKNMVGPVLGMASAMILLKQIQKAKNYLKKINHLMWNIEEAEYFEKSWLLLADIYIQANKIDMAESFVERVLKYNKSSAKAYEFKGIIAEKSQLYKDASKHYFNSWKHCGRTKPHIGYKLAYNYMKIKRYADAIDICQKIMKLYPDYTIIKKDIYDKCCLYIRN